MVCVRPGVLLVRASALRPTSALMALDLPTFERPANAISGGPGGGKSTMRPAARRNAASAKADMAKRANSNRIAPLRIRSSGMDRAVALALALAASSAATAQDKEQE